MGTGSIIACGVIMFLVGMIIYCIITADSNLKRYYNNINIGEVYVKNSDYGFPQRYSPWDLMANPNRYEVLDKKNGWLKLKKLSSGETVECSVKEMYMKQYIKED